MLNVGVIGIGNCGNQIACLAHKEAGCDVYVINTSEKDLSVLPNDIPKKVIGDAEGTGKNRESAKEFLKGSIMDIIRDEVFKTFISEKDIILVCSSTGGGSGSGMAPLMTNIIKETFRNPDGTAKIVILVGVLPRLNEGQSTQVNALSYLHEVYDIMEDLTYILYDNNNFNKETSYMVLQKVNQAVVQDIKIMQCLYNVATPYDSIDEKDMKTILSAPGRVSFAGIFGIKEKDLDGTTIEDMLIEAVKNSAHAELQRDGVLMHTGVISNLDTRLNEVFDSHLEKVRSFVGEPTEEFLHIAVNPERSLPNNVILILCGLTKISDRIEKIRDRIDEIEAAQKASSASVVDATIAETELNRLNEKRGTRVTNKVSADTSVDLKSIFGKFGA